MRIFAQLCINSVSSGLPLQNWSELNIKRGLSLSANKAEGWGLREVEILPNLCQPRGKKHLAKRYASDKKNTTFAIRSRASSGCVSSWALSAKGLLKFHYFIRSLAKEAKCVGFFFSSSSFPSNYVNILILPSARIIS